MHFSLTFFFPSLGSFLRISFIRARYDIENIYPLSTRLTSHSQPYPCQEPLDGTTASGQKSDTRPNSFQLLPQLHPYSFLQLGAFRTSSEARRRHDLAIRHVLAVGLSSYAGAVHERAGTNLGSAG